MMFTDPICQALGLEIGPLSLGAILLRIVLSAAMATVVGCERSSKRHAAGLRTFILTSLSSTVAMLMDCSVLRAGENGLYFFSAAVIVAAAIICVYSVLYTSKNQIKGLTTSSALWGCAMLGLGAGAGLYTVTLAAFALYMLVLAGMPRAEAYLKDRSNHFEIHLELKSSRSLPDFVATGRALGLIIDEIELNPAYANSGLSVYSVALSIKSAELKKYKTHKEIIEALGTLEYVNHVEEMR